MTTSRHAAYLLTAVLALGAAAPAALLPEPALAQAAKPKPKPKVKQLFPYWENYMRIPAAERTRFQLAYTLEANGRPVTDQTFFAVDGARREPIAVDSNGRLRPPPLEFFRSKTAVVDAPGATGRDFSVELELLATAAPAREMEAAEMTATIAQANAGIRKAAGLIGVVAPKMARAVFPGAGSGEAVGVDGRRTPLPKTELGSPYFQPAALPNVRSLVFARAPSRVTLAPAPKKARAS
jgi:hypothetical protein